MATKSKRIMKVAAGTPAPARTTAPVVLHAIGPTKAPRTAPVSQPDPSISGLYLEQAPGRGELRLDLDGPYPLMTVSGLVVGSVSDRVHWIAKLAPTGSANQWSGQIWYKDRTSALLPQTSVTVTARSGATPREVDVRFSGGGSDLATRVYRRKSAQFRQVEFEFDTVEGTSAVTEIDLHAHPNRPSDLPAGQLSIETVYRRAGFEVMKSGADDRVPLHLAGADRVWSDTEMHDAMQSYWSRFANKAQWSMWVLFAASHETGSDLGGIMFDSIGPNHRQGTAIFNDSFISVAPRGDAAPEAWKARMRFWTACHEMGHAFNLAHSWDKAKGQSWMPLSDEVEARSFMNYPYNVDGGQTAFFSDFAYRFSEQELLFMRHAPERMVQMGAADWFDDHAFRHAETSVEPKFQLALRANRSDAIFEFMEPCVLELKLTNLSQDPQLVSERVLEDSERMVVIIKKESRPARQWLPYAHHCYKARRAVLAAGASRYESLFVGAGRNGWDLAEPGYYAIQVSLRVAGQDVVSNALRIRVTPPTSHREEYIAQDLFTDEVGRVLAFDGSRVLTSANKVLHDVSTQLSGRAVAHHAQVALCRPLMQDGKVLWLTKEGGETPAAQPVVQVALASKRGEGNAGMQAALLKEPDKSARTLGHVDYKRYVDALSESLARSGDTASASKTQGALHKTLLARKVAGPVLEQIASKQHGYALVKRAG